MAETRFVAVVDIGKTNAKLVLHDLATGAEPFVATEPNPVRRDGPYPHFDAERLWAFLLDALARCAGVHRIDVLSVTTHGAAAALMDGSGLVLPVLDYESDALEATGEAYDRVRPAFAETFSPRLPNGLNLGAQIFWLETAFPESFARARHILTYPQYWVWRLTGAAASEVTSLGCHTDLWAPAATKFSSLVDARGWRAKLPPIRSAFEAVGPLLPDLAARVGLASRPVPVHCGIHDSNASLLPHLLSRQAPFTVLSTGTWIVAFAVGGSLDGLDGARDTLANVDALGRPVPSARFMGGREFDLLTGGKAVQPTPAEAAAVLADGVTALPTFAPGTGPCPEAKGAWTRDPASLSPGERTAAASLYCALMTAEALAPMRADGPTTVEGPFARNRLYLESLALLTGRPVAAATGATGTGAGAALLAAGRGAPVRPPEVRAVVPDGNLEAPLAAYARRWRARAV
ncbi:MAG: FGGY-family carbohydrate kinase [Geminicoccaceae bacterium]|nr:FGGY-family carbohydrate kinase [Geminicoccaceae bacterium]